MIKGTNMSQEYWWGRDHLYQVRVSGKALWIRFGGVSISFLSQDRIFGWSETENFFFKTMDLIRLISHHPKVKFLTKRLGLVSYGAVCKLYISVKERKSLCIGLLYSLKVPGGWKVLIWGQPGDFLRSKDKKN